MCATWLTLASGHSSIVHFYKTPAPEPLPVQDVIADIQRHLRGVRDKKLNLDELARRFALDKYQLIRHFKRQVGLTPHGYLPWLRIEQAQRLLAQGMAPVALKTGFYDQSHFARYFRAQTGLTPRRYQRNCVALGQQDIVCQSLT